MIEAHQICTTKLDIHQEAHAIKVLVIPFWSQLFFLLCQLLILIPLWASFANRQWWSDKNLNCLRHMHAWPHTKRKKEEEEEETKKKAFMCRFPFKISNPRQILAPKSNQEKKKEPVIWFWVWKDLLNFHLLARSNNILFLFAYRRSN